MQDCSEWVERNYAGLHPRDRKGKIIVLLRAFVDDSSDTGDDGIFALGGFVAPVDYWTNFATDWNDALREPPRINYYKTNYALGAKKDFNGWRDETIHQKLASLARVVDSDICKGISAYLTIKDHADVFKGGTIFPGEYGDPYYLTAFLLAERVAIHYEWHNLQPDVELVTSIDFVFDNRGKVGPTFENMFNFWLKPRYPLLAKCAHEDDRKFLPLQAADMYAAWVRRSKSPRVQLWTGADGYLEQISNVAEEKIKQEYLRDIKKLAQEHPEEMAAFRRVVEAHYQMRRALRRSSRLKRKT